MKSQQLINIVLTKHKFAHRVTLLFPGVCNLYEHSIFFCIQLDPSFNNIINMPNNKLPSVKRPFLGAKREMRQMHLPPWFWLAANMSHNFTWPMRTWGSLRIPFQCQRWCKFELVHFVLQSVQLGILSQLKMENNDFCPAYSLLVSLVASFAPSLH